MLRTLFQLFLFAPVFATLAACGGGGSDADVGAASSNGDLITDRCPALGLATRVRNGTECDGSNSPVVLIDLVYTDNSTSECSGTMISGTHVLSAAHCFPANTRSAFISVAGKRFNGLRYFRHPGYTPTAGGLFKDLAILELETSPSLPPVPVLVSHELERGDKIAIFGFGSNGSGGSGILRSGEMRVDAVTTDHIITSFDGNGSNACSGDSGGPALFEFKGHAGIVGVTSSGAVADCGVGDTKLFANVQSESYLSFIRSVVTDLPTL